MRDPGLNLLALSYRIIYGIAGRYIPAALRLAIRLRHAMISGSIGFVLSGAGVGATLPMDLGPAWYPIAIWLTACRAPGLGGMLHRQVAHQRQQESHA